MLEKRSRSVGLLVLGLVLLILSLVMFQNFTASNAAEQSDSDSGSMSRVGDDATTSSSAPPATNSSACGSPEKDARLPQATGDTDEQLDKATRDLVRYQNFVSAHPD